MQIKKLYKEIYKRHDCERKKECLQVYYEKYKSRVNQWETLKSASTNEARIPEFVDFCRATYYLVRQRLKELSKIICKRLSGIEKLLNKD